MQACGQALWTEARLPAPELTQPLPQQCSGIQVSDLDQWLQTPPFWNGWGCSPHLHTIPDFPRDWFSGRLSAVGEPWAYCLLLTGAGCLSLHRCSSELEVRMERTLYPLPPRLRPQAGPALPSWAPSSSEATVTAVSLCRTPRPCPWMKGRRSVRRGPGLQPVENVLPQTEQEGWQLVPKEFHLSLCSTPPGISGIGAMPGDPIPLGLSKGAMPGQLLGAAAAPEEQVWGSEHSGFAVGARQPIYNEQEEAPY